MTAGNAEADRRKNIEYARALEEDAELGDDACTDLVEAAGYWHLAAEHERECRLLERAYDLDVDAGPLSARGAYIGYLLTHGREAEAEPLLAAQRQNPSQVEQTYAEISMAYAATGAQQEALRWLDIGITKLLPDLSTELDLDLGDPGYELLRDRAELRAEAGMPADATDESFQRLEERAAAETEEIMRLGAQGRPATAPERAGAMGWTAEEFARVRHEHPDWYPDSTHEDYRRDVQRIFALESGARIVPGTLDDIRAWAAEEGLDPASPDTRDGYVAASVHTDAAQPWPPGRNDACWCGSGRKYKKCCGAPGFA
ncbi:hypothetical protein GCM10009854_12500 [Saccharopolyspora halophila]|uniref:SEC-C motif-containing protein n=1 Tax=Saccharopolyspora halophila TaxID=405551 RepID=A0ABN3FUC5_9PSEU